MKKLLVLMLIFLPVVAFAENSIPSATIINDVYVSDSTEEANAPLAFGTTGGTYETLTAWDFQPISSDVTYNYDYPPFSIYRTNVTGNVWFEAPVHIPSGARLEKIEFHYCDTGTGTFFSFLNVQPKSSGFPTSYTLITSTGTPGCVVQTATLGTPLTINNATNFYTVEVNMGGTGTAGNDTIQLSSARVGYRLQISPAPGTATFSDVPTSNPFFAYVEALYRSGITSGCGGGNYCPDALLTRGQMAVFLSKALGLHWPDY